MNSPALYALSGDPITLGHSGLIEKVSADHLVSVAIASNANKTPLFDPQERVRLAQLALK